LFCSVCVLYLGGREETLLLIKMNWSIQSKNVCDVCSGVRFLQISFLIFRWYGCRRDDIRWNDTQPWKCNFLESNTKFKKCLNFCFVFGRKFEGWKVRVCLSSSFTWERQRKLCEIFGATTFSIMTLSITALGITIYKTWYSV